MHFGFVYIKTKIENIWRSSNISFLGLFSSLVVIQLVGLVWYSSAAIEPSNTELTSF